MVGRYIFSAYPQGQLEEGIIALPSEVEIRAFSRAHEAYAALSVQARHPAVDQPAGQPARHERIGRQEHKFELL